MKKQTLTSDDAILAELTAIKRLLIYALLHSGAGQDGVAVAAGVAQSTISKMFPGGFSKIEKKRKG